MMMKCLSFTALIANGKVKPFQVVAIFFTL